MKQQKMSFSFQIKSSKRTSYKELSKELEIDDIEYSNSPSDAEEKILKTTLYVAHKSVRGAFLEFVDDIYSVKIRTISSEDDIRLAIQVAKCIAKITAAPISPEGVSRDITIAELDEYYDSKWIDGIKMFGVEIYKKELENKTGTFALWTCNMNYFIGPKVHKKLDNRSVESYYYSLLDHIRSTQLFDKENYIIAPIRVLEHRETGVRSEAVTFYSHGNQFLSFADIIIFLDLEETSFIQVPYSLLSKIKHDKIKRVDEVQYTIDELSKEEYEKIFNSIKKAADYLEKKNTKIENESLNKRKRLPEKKASVKTKKKDAKWWEFWKN